MHSPSVNRREKPSLRNSARSVRLAVLRVLGQGEGAWEVSVGFACERSAWILLLLKLVKCEGDAFGTFDQVVRCFSGDVAGSGVVPVGDLGGVSATGFSPAG